MAIIQQNVKRYPFDPYGTADTNKVVQERQVITPKNGYDFHYFIPEFAPFYEKDFKLYTMDATGKKTYLIEGVDYNFGMRFIRGSYRTQQAIYGSVSFVNRKYNGNVFIDYRTVGGDWTISQAEILKILAEWLSNPIWTSWDNVANPPYAFPPVDHVHPIDDFVGMGDILIVMEKILAAAESGTQSGLLNHLADYNNPHKVTKAQVGLAKVLNLAILPQGSGADKSDNYYMSPRSTVDLFNTQFKPLLDAHIALRNPHGTRPIDIGTLSTAEINALLANKLDLNGIAFDTARFGNRTPEQYRNYVLLGRAADSTLFNGLTYTEVVNDILNRVAISGGGGGGISPEDLERLLATATVANSGLFDGLNKEQYAQWFMINNQVNAALLNGKTASQIVAEAVASKVADSLYFDGMDVNQYATWLLTNFSIDADTLNGLNLEAILLEAKAQTVNDALRVGGYTPEELRDWISASGLDVESLNGKTAQEIIDEARLGVNADLLQGKNVQEIVDLVHLEQIDAATLGGKSYSEIMTEVDTKISDAGFGANINASTLQGKDIAGIIEDARDEFNGTIDAGTLNNLNFNQIKAQILAETSADSDKLEGLTLNEVLAKAWDGPREFDGFGIDNNAPKMIRLYTFPATQDMSKISFLLRLTGLGIYKPEMNDTLYLEVNYMPMVTQAGFGSIPVCKGYMANNGTGKTTAELNSVLSKRFWVGAYTDTDGSERLGLYYYDQLQECTDYYAQFQTVTMEFIDLEAGDDIRLDLPLNVNAAVNTVSGNYVKAPFTFLADDGGQSAVNMVYDTVADMLANPPAEAFKQVYLNELSVGEGSGGMFHWYQNIQATNELYGIAMNAGTGHYQRVCDGESIHASLAGLKGSDTVDESARLTEILNYATATGLKVILDRPQYTLKQTVNLTLQDMQKLSIRTDKYGMVNFNVTDAVGFTDNTVFKLSSSGQDLEVEMRGFIFTASPDLTLVKFNNGHYARGVLELFSLSGGLNILDVDSSFSQLTLATGEVYLASDNGVETVRLRRAVHDLKINETTVNRIVIDGATDNETMHWNIDKSKITNLNITPSNPNSKAELRAVNSTIKGLDLNNCKLISESSVISPKQPWSKVAKGSYLDKASILEIAVAGSAYVPLTLRSGELSVFGMVNKERDGTGSMSRIGGDDAGVPTAAAYLSFLGADIQAGFSTLGEATKDGAISFENCKLRNKSVSDILFKMIGDNVKTKIKLKNNDWSEIVKGCNLLSMAYTGTGETMFDVNDIIDIGDLRVTLGNTNNYDNMVKMQGKIILDNLPGVSVHIPGLKGAVVEARNPVLGMAKAYRTNKTLASASDISALNTNVNTRMWTLVEQAGVKIGDTATRPTGLTLYDAGLRYLNTETAKEEVWTGSAWI